MLSQYKPYEGFVIDLLTNFNVPIAIIQIVNYLFLLQMTDVEMTEDKEPNYHLSAIIQAHKGTARCLAIDPVGTLISGGHDDYVRFWAKRCFFLQRLFFF